MDGDVKFFYYMNKRLYAVLAGGNSFIADDIEIFCQTFTTLLNVASQHFRCTLIFSAIYHKTVLTRSGWSEKNNYTSWACKTVVVKTHLCRRDDEPLSILLTLLNHHDDKGASSRRQNWGIGVPRCDVRIFEGLGNGMFCKRCWLIRFSVCYSCHLRERFSRTSIK